MVIEDLYLDGTWQFMLSVEKIDSSSLFCSCLVNFVIETFISKSNKEDMVSKEL